MRIASQSKDDLSTKLGLSTMARFAFGSTLPHGGVSEILQKAFFSCCHESKSPFPVVSEFGISCASDSQFRQSNKDLSFLKRYRVLHKEIDPLQCAQIIEHYRIPRFKFGDIVREFEKGVTQDVMKAFFGWWEDVKRNSHSSAKSKEAAEIFCKEFPSRGVLRSSHGVNIVLKNIKYYTSFSLPNDLTRPDTLHIDFSSGVPTRDTIKCFGWVQLSLLDWLEYTCAHARQPAQNKDSDQDSDMGYRISRVLVQFALVEDLSLQQWDRVAELMKDIECIPTNMGLKLPADSYFDEADICRSLPVAQENIFLNIPATPVAVERRFEYNSKSVNPEHVRKVLARIRVRRMMDWEDMVAKYVNWYGSLLAHHDRSYRLETVASEETNDRLLQYLAIILRVKLTDQQINDLKKKKIFYSKNHGRVSATELYLPNEDMRKLGLPILALPRNGIASLQSIVDPSGSFAVEPFIEYLGIQRYPTLDKIIALAASNEPDVQRSALQYLLSNLETRYDAYKPEDFANVAFIPTKSGSLARLNEVA